MDFGIAGKNALVCAGSKGIGRAIAQELANEGVNLFLCARNTETLEKTAADIRQASGVSVHTFACDLATAEGRAALTQTVQKVFPTLDILVHNVGGPPGTQAETTSQADWQNGFERLFLSVSDLNQAFIPAMKTQQWGRVVIITSIAVVEPVPGLAVSNALRAAVTGMAKTLSDELAPFNITVNCVAPGIIHTDRIEERIQAEMVRLGGTHAEQTAAYINSIPMGRMGTPEEFAAVAAFLCSARASYLTGSTLCVDGGKRRAAY